MDSYPAPTARCTIRFRTRFRPTISTRSSSYPEEVQNRVAFARAGTMHNFSYLGGFLGIVTGSAYLLAERYRLRRKHLGSSNPMTNV